MSCNIIKKEAIDTTKWLQFIEKYDLGLYHSYEYLDAVCLGHWSAIELNNEYYIPIYIKRKWGISYVCMPPFTQKFDSRFLNQEQLELIFKTLKRNFLKINIRFSHMYHVDIPKTEKRNFILNLSNSYSDIYNKYHSLLKKNLLKANGLEFQKHQDYSDIDSFMTSNELFQSLVLSQHKEVFERMVSIKSKELKLNYYSVKELHTTDCLACCITISYRNTEYLLFPYSSVEGRRHQAMSFLIDNIIKESTAQFLDFEGSSIESIAHFYRQFGAVEETYYEIKMGILN